MDIVFLLFDRFTALDGIGPYEVLSRLPGIRSTNRVVDDGERLGAVDYGSRSVSVRYGLAASRA